MDNEYINQQFSNLSTPIISDACLKLKIPFRTAPAGIFPVIPNSHIAGRVLPVQHHGSVDIFLEAMRSAQKGDILVIDNNGRKDEGCIGDLTVLEAQAWKIAGIILWGSHRDTKELKEIKFPVFSYGIYPGGPKRLDSRNPDSLVKANFGNFSINSSDIAFADEDGAIFVSDTQIQQILSAAQDIWNTERRQAKDIISGKKLSDQLKFEEYLEKNSKDPNYTFRKHLGIIGGAIEQ